MGQLFYGWFTTAMVLFQAASAFFEIWRRPENGLHTNRWTPPNQP